MAKGNVRRRAKVKIEGWTATDAVRWRERMGLTQRQAADAQRVHLNTIGHREHGRRKIAACDALLMLYIEKFGPLA
jgi:hypothetical protein